jgi:hypothetical protein
LNIGELQAQSSAFPPKQEISPVENENQSYNILFEGGMARHSLEPTSIGWDAWLPVLIRRIAVLISTTRTPLWRRWVLATTLGVPLAVSASFLGGILLGLAQWLVLRKLSARPNRWVFATGVGWVLGLMLAMLIASGFTYTSMASILAIAFGSPFMFTLLGLAQWFVLKERFANARWWILATTVGGTIGMAIGGAIGLAISLLSSPWAVILGIISFAVIFGATTGTAMVWLLKQSHSRAHLDSQTAPPG